MSFEYPLLPRLLASFVIDADRDFPFVYKEHRFFLVLYNFILEGIDCLEVRKGELLKLADSCA